MEKLLKAILEDDRCRVRMLIEADGPLAMTGIRKPRLYTSKILHWIYEGDIALHLAAAGYRVEIVRLLMRAGADPNAAGNRRQSSPLHYAADGFVGGPAWNPTRQVHTIRCLLKQGGKINSPDENGATPLHRAVRTRCAAAVRCLLRSGSDPSLKNKSGSTPFHLAVQNTGHGGTGRASAKEAQSEIIQEFLAFGVSPELENAQGKSVRDSVQSDWVHSVLKAAG